MAQTTAAQSGVDCLVEFSTNGSDWTDISGSIKMVDAGEQSRQSGEDYTLNGDYALVTGGKFDPVEVSATGLWTPTAGEAFAVVHAAWTAKSPAYLRWSPQGGNSGHKRYTTNAGVLTGFVWPKGDATDAKPIPCGFKLKTPKITESTIS